MMQVVTGPSRTHLADSGEAYLPFHSLWGQDAFTVREPFHLDPARTPANSTSGSPVAVVKSVFAGLLQPTPGSSFVAEHGSVWLDLAEGARALIARDGDWEAAWRAYNDAVLAQIKPAVASPEPGVSVEYCTWVEQKAHADQRPPEQVLDEDFVQRFLDRLAALELPPGTVTIDSGWFARDGQGSAGDWEPDPGRLPDLAGIATAIRDSGHVPGIWIAPALVDPGSRYAHRHPERLGAAWSGDGEAPAGMRRWRYVSRDDALLAPTFRRLADAGFGKVKLDILYGPRHDMLEVVRGCREAAEASGEHLVLEHHVPDIFSAALVEVVRSNDVLVTPGRPWRELTATNWSVCARSAPGRVLNLDHVGGNDPSVTRDDYLQHWRMFDRRLRVDPAGCYPTLSLLPDRFGPDVVAEIRTGLWAHHWSMLDQGDVQ